MLPSKYLYFEVTRACNERCVQCFNNSGKRLPGELTTDLSVQLIHRFKSFGGAVLQLTGGEVYSKPGIDEIIEEAGQAGFEHLTVSTNATLLNKKRLTAIESHVDECDVSLDGFAETHDLLRGLVSFDKTTRALRQLTELSGVRVHVCTCVSRPLLAKIREFLDYLVSLHVHSVKLALIEDVGRGATPRDWMIPRASHRELYWEFERLRSEYSSRIMIEQSLSLNPVLPSIAVDGLVCDPRGKLYPLIGFLPDYWIVGSAHPDFDVDLEKLNQYKLEADSAVLNAIDDVASGNPVNWWELIHRRLDSAASVQVQV